MSCLCSKSPKASFTSSGPGASATLAGVVWWIDLWFVFVSLFYAEKSFGFLRYDLLWILWIQPFESIVILQPNSAPCTESSLLWCLSGFPSAMKTFQNQFSLEQRCIPPRSVLKAFDIHHLSPLDHQDKTLHANSWRLQIPTPATRNPGSSGWNHLTFLSPLTLQAPVTVTSRSQKNQQSRSKVCSFDWTKLPTWRFTHNEIKSSYCASLDSHPPCSKQLKSSWILQATPVFFNHGSFLESTPSRSSRAFFTGKKNTKPFPTSKFHQRCSVQNCKEPSASGSTAASWLEVCHYMISRNVFIGTSRHKKSDCRSKAWYHLLFCPSQKLETSFFMTSWILKSTNPWTKPPMFWEIIPFCDHALQCHTRTKAFSLQLPNKGKGPDAPREHRDDTLRYGRFTHGEG